ncbi:WD40 repeat domain-containing protein [Streptomyces sp. NPDC088789]|uniref:WD40 repeat domain-containing protein n=1 Tax=Streptomyces sp. NPDC088789 TaxID=3365899 RepID=UPI00380252A3
MNTEELVRSALREQAAEQTPLDSGFADRVLGLRRRRHGRRLAVAAVATAAVVAVGVGVPLLDTTTGGGGTGLAGVGAGGDDVLAHPDQSPPRDQVAVGKTLLGAHYTTEPVAGSGDSGVLTRTYSLLDPDTRTYRKDDRWSYVALAPGGRTAAVLERELPTRRIGLLDLATGEVERWIPVQRGVAAVGFSADGRRIVATTYSENPDQLRRSADAPEGSGGWEQRWDLSGRTGFYAVDVPDGKADWTRVDGETGFEARGDFGFSEDGRSLWTVLTEEGVGETSGEEPRYYNLSGDRIDQLTGKQTLGSEAGMWRGPHSALGTYDQIVETTERVDSKNPDLPDLAAGTMAIAPIGGGRWLAWDMKDGAPDRIRLVVTPERGDRSVPLTGYRRPPEKPGQQPWEPLFTTGS